MITDGHLSLSQDYLFFADLSKCLCSKSYIFKDISIDLLNRSKQFATGFVCLLCLFSFKLTKYNFLQLDQGLYFRNDTEVTVKGQKQLLAPGS